METDRQRNFGAPGRWAMWRIYRIDAYLRERAFPNVPRLAEKLEVGRRTIERDLAHLRDMMNAPLEYDRKRNGYHYTSEFQLTPVALTEGEAVALFLGSRLLTQYRGTPYEGLIRDAFDKIRLVLPKTLSLDFSLVNETISFAVEQPRGDEQHLLQCQNLLAAALRERHSVKLKYYTASRDARTHRLVDPYHLRCHQGAWYLIAYCHRRREVRTFALDRITELQATDQQFTPDPEFSIEGYLGDSLALERGGPPEAVRIRFDPFQARYIRERQWHPSQEIEEHPDGALTLTLRLRGLGEVKRWLLGFGPRAEVLTPQRLREEVAQEVRLMGGMYGV
jgi:predicted DNA-binding transcriptional regulator YafY